MAAPCPLSGKKKLWCSCATVSGSSVLPLKSSGDKTRSWRRPRMRRAQPRCPVSPQKQRIFCLEKARAFSGLIFQKLKSLAAATRAMDVRRLQQLVESSPNAPRTRPAAACASVPSRAPLRAPRRPVDLVVQRASLWRVLLGHKRRALLGGVVLPLVRVLCAEGATILAASQRLRIRQCPHKGEETIACIQIW